MGYDISDYKCIDPVYGTNEDMDVLIAELKSREMKLMMGTKAEMMSMYADHG